MELTQYYVKSTNMTKTEFEEYTKTLVFIVLGRRFLSNFLTIYLPTILLNVIGHTTVYFKEGFQLKIYGSRVIIRVGGMRMHHNILWPFGHMTIWLYDTKGNQDGYFQKPYHKYSNLVTELN